jgi:hypothetical protein
MALKRGTSVALTSKTISSLMTFVEPFQNLPLHENVSNIVGFGDIQRGLL